MRAINRLPDVLKSMYTFHTTRKGGVTHELLRRITRCRIDGSNFSALYDDLYAIRVERMHRSTSHNISLMQRYHCWHDIQKVLMV